MDVSSISLQALLPRRYVGAEEQAEVHIVSAHAVLLKSRSPIETPSMQNCDLFSEGVNPCLAKPPLNGGLAKRGLTSLVN